MPNTNCLEGMRCPECGYKDAFLITVSVDVEVRDDGTDSIYGDIEWEGTSRISCRECAHLGTVAEFTGPSLTTDNEDDDDN